MNLAKQEYFDIRVKRIFLSLKGSLGDIYKVSWMGQFLQDILPGKEQILQELPLKKNGSFQLSSLINMHYSLLLC